MDAHRQRELKWMSVMGSVPPAQSKKTKKVKKLLFDGVPSSVRYLVWNHLTDGKARCVPGVYTQLGGRERVPALMEVERDVQRCFVDHPQLQSTQGPVLSLLQAYLTMVPDIQYTTGLTLIAGHLLLLAPEEDAFWIFVSIMDTHIRAYYSSTASQVDVDASLFSRALESVDPAVAKKMFTDLSIPPNALCRPWFTSLFVGCLPSDYLNRVWDIFLFEGVPFLLRVALVLVSCCRRQILESTSKDAVLNVVLRPSPASLPSSPEAFITLSLAVKLKDDDFRKQRVKLEAQAKRQTQTPRMVSTPGAISLPRT
ncbi:rab-GTPase-TBC domain-containing protein [Lyophyllum atratum]|nr:rab-GTPase-TBC domain-containing protein [Lyophyllum atratum]